MNIAVATNAAIGRISRVQRYKIAANREQEFLKICIFLMRNISQKAAPR